MGRKKLKYKCSVVVIVLIEKYLGYLGIFLFLKFIIILEKYFRYLVYPLQKRIRDPPNILSKKIRDPTLMQPYIKYLYNICGYYIMHMNVYYIHRYYKMF